MIGLSKVLRYCKDCNLIENYGKAVADETQMWECHHRAETDENLTKEQLIEQGRYWNVEPSELIFLTPSEHKKIHYDSELGEEKKRKLSKRMKGNKYRLGIKHTEETLEKIRGHIPWNKGATGYKKLSDDDIKRLSDSKRGKHWFNNGICEVFCLECPDGYVKGRIKRNKTTT